MSDSDRTIDSDELSELIASQKRELPCIGNSDSSGEKQHKSKRMRCKNPHELSDSSSDTDVNDHRGSNRNKRTATKKSLPRMGILSDSCSSTDEENSSVPMKMQSQSLKTHHTEDCDKDSSTTDIEDNNEGEMESAIVLPSTSKNSNSVQQGRKNAVLDKRPKCKYGINCYRKNPDHLKMFSHDMVEVPIEVSEAPTKRPSPSCNEVVGAHHENVFSFYLTTVSGIPSAYNDKSIALGITDLLSCTGRKLRASAQFNYMFDIPWLIEQYPAEFRKCPLTIVHGEQGIAKQTLEKFGKIYQNITFCQAKLDIPFGTHHTKMMILYYEDGLRVVIHTSNLVHNDWFEKTQGMWVSPLFSPMVGEVSPAQGDSATGFRADLVDYIRSYRNKSLEEWCSVLMKHDMSQAKVCIIGSIPGRHVGSRKTAFGHLKLRKVLNMQGPSKTEVSGKWPVIGQFSSIGSLGATPNSWLCTEWLTSFSTVKGLSSGMPASLKLVYPSVNNVRLSLEGYPAGASLPYSNKVAVKQPYLKTYLHQWKSRKLSRHQASPHIKSYTRLSPDNKSTAWFLLTSANLSKAAWGSLEKNDTQFMIRSYELGVLFLPQYFGLDKFYISESCDQDASKIFRMPYDIPLAPYSSDDEPWIWDIPHVQLPDTHGNMWCPS